MTTSPGHEDLTPQDRAVSALRVLLQAGDVYRHKVASHFELGWTEIQAVSHLMTAGELGQTELAGRLGITTAAATSLVDRLEAADIAARHPHPQDRRRSNIRLTDKGLEIIERSRKWTEHAFDGLSASRLDAALALLTSMAENLYQQSEQI